MRHGNFSYVIDSSFTPFTMQEMLVPFTAYKDEYEKEEAAYTDLSEKADKFKYLSQTLPDDSRARQIYEGYANDLQAQATDLAQNGLGMNNRRALTNLKRRYQGEIGRLVEADTALKKEQELRRQMSAKDPSMLYADENLSIDRFLDNNTPNLYGISGTELYTKGAAAGKAASSRVYGAKDAGSTLGGYYRDYVQRMGYTPEQLRQFGDQISADFAAQVSVLPELQQAANQILDANGVTENFKNNPSALRKAQQQVIRGIIDGSVYTEKHDPTRDLSKTTAAEDRQYNLQIQGMERQAAANGLTWDNKNKRFTYSVKNDPKYAPELWKYDIDDATGQIKGYSKAYEDAVKKGMVPGKNIKMGADGKSVVTETKDNRKPKGNMYFTKKGSSTFTTKDGRNLGKQISYAEAVQKYPEIRKYVGNDSDLYDYWDSGVGVYTVGHPKSTEQSSSSLEEDGIKTDNNNQL